jgi:hypothetical protein
MSITVYWSLLDDPWLRATKPKPVFKNFFQDHIENSSNDSFERMFKCPAVSSYIKNLYAISSLYDYTVKINEDNSVVSDQYTQNFFDKHIIIRDAKLKFISFTQPYIFFTEEKSLEMTWQITPYLEKESSINYFSVPGKFDIGKWFRPMDFSFIMKESESVFSIKENQAYSYINFNTDEKIIFKKFAPTEKIYLYSNACIRSNSGRRVGGRSMIEYYKTFSIKPKIIKEIKKNLID